MATTLPSHFSIEPKGKITSFGHHNLTRISLSTPCEESADWPSRYAKICVQASDWLRHESVCPPCRYSSHRAYRTFDPSHIFFKLLEPHWQTTLSLNKAARETLVPKIIIPLTETQTYAFIQAQCSIFKWTGSYVPNDLRKRGFQIEDLDKLEYHNYGYAHNMISHTWDSIIRKFVSTNIYWR